MATYKYKVKGSDTLQLGESDNTVSIPSNASIAGTLSVTGVATLGGDVKTFEYVTTTGTSDVVDPAKYASIVVSSGAHTVTLADGTYDGQVKKIILLVDGGTVTLTPTHLVVGTSITFADALDSVELIFDGNHWHIAQASGIAIVE